MSLQEAFQILEHIVAEETEDNRKLLAAAKVVGRRIVDTIDPLILPDGWKPGNINSIMFRIPGFNYYLERSEGKTDPILYVLGEGHGVECNRASALKFASDLEPLVAQINNWAKNKNDQTKQAITILEG